MRFLVYVFGFIIDVIPCRAQTINFVFTSDLHYGITRPHFRGHDSVESYIVNSAAVDAINSLPSKGVRNIEAILVTGDIANREEAGIQPASVSWEQFLHDYKDGIRIRTKAGAKPLLLVTPGNHDASNAAGHSKITFRDASAMTGMIALETGVKIDTVNYDYSKGSLNYSREIGGIHFVFLNIWPDSANRIWLEKDLSPVDGNMPVLLFMHDQPQGDPKHFTNPDNDFSRKAGDKFEHLLAETYKDTISKSTMIEQKGIVAMLRNHPNIKAWFHGHENFCEMYDYRGIAGELLLPVFRSDSPMKGEKSKQDERQLSFQVITIDLEKRKLTSRECLWNRDNEAGKMRWGMSRTIFL